MENDGKKNVSAGSQQPERHPLRVVMVLLPVLLVLLVVLIRRCTPPEVPITPLVADSTLDSVTVADSSGEYIDTTRIAESDTMIPVSDTVAVLPKRSSERKVPVPVDTVSIRDTVESPRDSLTDTVTVMQPPVKGCGGDTSALWVYPDPSGGLHRREVEVLFHANRPAVIHYRFQGDTGWTKYTGDPVVISVTTTLHFDAIDTCGTVMEHRSEYYEIETVRSSALCAKDMEQVQVGEMDFCVDRYEWPNRRGVIPRSYVSLYQAMDSCFSAGKRLCTAEEWAVACSGPYSWKYPYGQGYEPYACGTHDSVVAPSGSRPECRSFFGLFDMAGNLLEWTSTKAVENSSFYYVAGGFWESGPKSACHDKRYSYYPQNRHNPVGFRCCSDVAAPFSAKPGGKR